MQSAEQLIGEGQAAPCPQDSRYMWALFEEADERLFCSVLVKASTRPIYVAATHSAKLFYLRPG